MAPPEAAPGSTQVLPPQPRQTVAETRCFCQDQDCLSDTDQCLCFGKIKISLQFVQHHRKATWVPTQMSLGTRIAVTQ